MLISDIDQLDSLSADQLWNVAANNKNEGEIRLEAFNRWLYPDDIDQDADPDELSGQRLRELKERAEVLDEDDARKDDAYEDDEEMAPYFDPEGQLIFIQDGVTYLIDRLDDEGGYDGIDNDEDLITEDEKLFPDRDL